VRQFDIGDDFDRCLESGVRRLSIFDPVDLEPKAIALDALAIRTGYTLLRQNP
jgi:hypothetical protein